MSDGSERDRRDIEQLLRGLRQDVVQGRVTLYREHLAEDATVRSTTRSFSAEKTSASSTSVV